MNWMIWLVWPMSLEGGFGGTVEVSLLRSTSDIGA